MTFDLFNKVKIVGEETIPLFKVYKFNRSQRHRIYLEFCKFISENSIAFRCCTLQYFMQCDLNGNFNEILRP